MALACVGRFNLETVTEYSAGGRVETVTNPQGYETSYDYDDAGRLETVVAPGDRITRYAYDENGQVTLVRIMDADGVTTLSATATAYDAMGRVHQTIVDPDAPSYTGMKLTTEYSYDALGRPVQTIEPEGQITATAYDSAGRLHTITDAAPTPGQVEFFYDAASRVTAIENARGQSTGFTHDPMGRVASTTDPLLRVHEYAYNGLGQLTLHEDPNGNDLTYEYDAANRLERIYDPNTVGTIGDYANYGYDALGRVIAIDNYVDDLDYVYDEAGRLKQVVSPQGTVAYQYNAAGQRTKLTMPGPREVNYTYDATSGDLATVTDWTDPDPTEFDYDAAGQLDEIQRPNGVTSLYGYDAALRLIGISHMDGSTALAEFGYAYDANGNRTRLDVSGTDVTNGYELYGYDELNRLDYVRYPDASEVEFGYDPNGNLTTVGPVGGTSIAYEYDAADQLQEVDNVFYSTTTSTATASATGPTHLPGTGRIV